MLMAFLMFAKWWKFITKNKIQLHCNMKIGRHTSVNTGCFQGLICFISRHPFCGGDLYITVAWEQGKQQQVSDGHIDGGGL